MTEFLTPVDIANRALQHCGADRIDPAKGFSEISKSAKATAFAYGKLRRAELRRNVWRTAIRRAVLRSITPTTMKLVPSLWMSTVTYFVGSIVADQSANLWISRVPNNLGNDPLNTLMWEPYFGPLTVSLYDSTVGYFAGELVYTAAGDGTNKVFLSLQNSNTDNPAAPTAWDAGTAYFKNQVVTYSSVAYMSLIDLNTNQQPDLAPALWDDGTSYSTGDKVGASNGVIYESLGTGNIGNDPVSDGGVNWLNTGVLNPWTTVFVGGAGSLKWLEVGGAGFPYGVTIEPLNIVYPLGAQLSPQTNFRNTFRLPNGFLRKANQNPNPVTPWLGGPSGTSYSDWTFEGDYLVTSDVGPIQFRFVADITDVRAMDDMFCEGLAARIGMEVCEELTQSSAKTGTIAQVYDEWISQARTVNGIETGAEEPPDDDYLTVRY